MFCCRKKRNRKSPNKGTSEAERPARKPHSKIKFKMSRTKSKDKSVLAKAQTMTKTLTGKHITRTKTKQFPTLADQENSRHKLPPDYRIILEPPFSSIDKITPNLYLSGIGGLVQENIHKNQITCIINATYEAPHFQSETIDSFRVPVDDQANENLFDYFDEIADLIEKTAKQGGVTVVHCIAGVSRSASFVIAYLIKYKNMTLKEAYKHVKQIRPVSGPNQGFMNQLIQYEQKLKGKTTVKLIKINHNGVDMVIPDFMESEIPNLMDQLQGTFTAEDETGRYSSEGYNTLNSTNESRKSRKVLPTTARQLISGSNYQS